MVKSGIDTISNRLTFDGETYYALGFHFESASLKPTNGQPFPDLTLVPTYNIDDELVSVMIEGPPGISNPFALVGAYSTEAEAIEAMGAVREIETEDYRWSRSANGIEPNQVWVYITPGSHFAKFRIVSVQEKDPEPDQNIVKCSFQWVFQPDGNLPFPQ